MIFFHSGDLGFSGMILVLFIFAFPVIVLSIIAKVFTKKETKNIDIFANDKDDSV